jgi:hypothetical protein
MMRLAMACMTLLLVLAAGVNEHKFSRLKTVETYEIRPGILMIPIYSDTGEVCRIVLEKRHVSSKSVDLEGEMSGKEIFGIFDELAPKKERGRPKFNEPEGSSTTYIDGPAATTIAGYENVSLQMHGKYKNGDMREFYPEGEGGRYVAATIDWEKRKCRDSRSDEMR